MVTPTGARQASGIVSAAAAARHENASSGEVAWANEPTPGPITAPVEKRPMTMPASRGRLSRGVLAESQAIEAAHVMPAAMPCSARAPTSTSAFGASANAIVENVSSSEPPSAMRRPPMRGVKRPASRPITGVGRG